MDLQSIGRVMVIGGIVLAVIGGIVMLIARDPNLQLLFFTLFGKIPGQLRIEGQGFSCLIPIGSMIILSVILTIVLNIIVRLINRP